MNPAPNFDRVARLYRWAEYLALGPLLQRTRTHFLRQLQGSRHALVLGDGDGRFLVELLRQYPQTRALAIDTSALMLQLLQQRCAFASERLQTQRTSLLTVTPSPETDLIVTHFVLDCFTQTEVDDLAVHFAATSKPGTLWLVSDFGIPTPTLARHLARAYIRMLYFVFRLLTNLRVRQLPNPQHALANAGFDRIQRHATLQGFVYTELWRRR